MKGFLAMFVVLFGGLGSVLNSDKEISDLTLGLMIGSFVAVIMMMGYAVRLDRKKHGRLV